MRESSSALSLLLLAVLLVVYIEGSAADAPLPSDASAYPSAAFNASKAHLHHYRMGKRRMKPIPTVETTSSAVNFIPKTATPHGTPQLKRRRHHGTTPNPNRDGRFLSLFTVVQFDNQACAAVSGDNGTCMTLQECAARGGLASGPCAGNFGVCCVFQATCGQSTRENCTYFTNMGYPQSTDGTGSCQLTIHKARPDICQFRLDFDQFNIQGPESMNNVCNNDQFIVSGGNPVPAICGINTGNHMYVDAGMGVTNPVTLTFVTSGPSFPRNWKVKVCQIPCSASYRAEEGCLQYFTGVSGTIKSFNYDPTSGLQLSNQDYSICVRMERNFCGIQYSQCPDTVNNRSHSFTISGNTMNQNPLTSMTGSQQCSSDWLIIPCVNNVGRISMGPATSTCVDRLCGGTLSAEISTTPSTVFSQISASLFTLVVCSKDSASLYWIGRRRQGITPSSVLEHSRNDTKRLQSTVKPFRLAYHTNNIEAPTDAGNRGFCLNFVQQPCTNNLN